MYLKISDTCNFAWLSSDPFGPRQRGHHKPGTKKDSCVGVFSVGARGFEPPTSCTPCKRASRAAPRPDWQESIIVAFEVSCNQMTFTPDYATILTADVNICMRVSNPIEPKRNQV